MKLYKFVFRTYEENDNNPHEIVGFSVDFSSERVLSFLKHVHLGKDEQFDCKIIPATTGHTMSYTAPTCEIILNHDITKEILNQSLDNNDVFLGAGYDRIGYHGDCVFISSHVDDVSQRIDTTTIEEYLKYAEEHYKEEV